MEAMLYDTSMDILHYTGDGSEKRVYGTGSIPWRPGRVRRGLHILSEYIKV